MNKQEFLNQLREAFVKYEIPENKSEKYFKKFEKLIDEVEEKDQAAKIEEFGSPDDIAKKFKELIEQKKEIKKKEKKEKENNKELIETENQDEEEPQKNQVVSVRGKYVFIGGTIITSPIWLAALAIIAGCFLAILGAMIALDIAIAVAMIGAVAVGGLAVISGSIYGIIGMLPGEIEPYIGQYELGLALMILGALIVAGILVHFFVVKVTPIVFKYTIRLAKFVGKQIIRLILFIRKECDKI